MSMSSVASCSFTLNKTLTRFSEKGRPFTTASCARRTLAAATSFMASVIFCVFFTVAIRSRKSFKLAVTTELPRPSRLAALSPVNISTDPAGSPPRRPSERAERPLKVAILRLEPQAMEDAIAAAGARSKWPQKFPTMRSATGLRDCHKGDEGDGVGAGGRGVGSGAGWLWWRWRLILVHTSNGRRGRLGPSLPFSPLNVISLPRLWIRPQAFCLLWKTFSLRRLLPGPTKVYLADSQSRSNSQEELQFLTRA
jgi:hypothetical protein